MKVELLTLIAILFAINLLSQDASIKENESAGFDIKASFSKGDLNSFLGNNVTYPSEALASETNGYVILSFIITSEGKIDSIIPIKFPSKKLALISIVGLQKTDSLWNPTIVNGKAVDWKYKIAFKFSIYKDVMPPKYLIKADEYYNQGNYKKAAKYYSKAIKKNKYKHDIYLKRSFARNKIGEIEGSNEDKETMFNLYKEFIDSIEIIAVGFTRSTR